MNEHPPLAAASLTATLIAFLGPTAGEYLAILLASFIGAMWALSARPTVTKTEAAMFLLRMVGTAVIFSGTVAWLLERKWGLPAHHVLAGAAFFIAFVGDRWEAILADAIARFRQQSGGQQ